MGVEVWNRSAIEPVTLDRLRAQTAGLSGRFWGWVRGAECEIEFVRIEPGAAVVGDEPRASARGPNWDETAERLLRRIAANPPLTAKERLAELLARSPSNE